DLSSRHGLRKAYSQFDRIYTELDAFHQLAKARNSPQLLLEVMSIFIKMCADSILKEKLFERGSFINKLMDLLDHDLTRYMGLQILLSFTYDGCRAQDVVLDAIARHSQTLSRVIQSSRPGGKVAELSLIVLSHSMQFLISRSPSTSDQPSQDASWRDALRSVFALLRRPHPSRSMMTHSLMLLVTATRKNPAYFKDDIRLNMLLVALLHARNLPTRAAAMEGLLVLCQVDSGPDAWKFDLRQLALSLKHTVPPPAALTFVSREEYPQWLQSSDSACLHRLSNEYVEAVSQAARDRDFSSLGRSIANIVQRSPLVIDGNWEELEKRMRSGQHAQSPRLHISRWSDALPECAKALRLTGTASDCDAADILDLKYLMLRDHKAEALALAKDALERNPDNAFACYVISLGGDANEGLNAATQGLRCPELTPFLRKLLLWRAVETGVWQGLEKILTADIGDQHAQERGVALLRAAYEQTDAFLAETSPDAHLRVTMLAWKILLTFLLHGSELDDHLRDIQHVCDQIDTSTAVMEFFGITIHKTRVHETRIRILRLNERSLEAWRPVIECCNAFNAPVVCSGMRAEHEVHLPAMDQAPTSEAYLGLQRCSWCGAFSATLKKCKGCGEARRVNRDDYTLAR
ncbi:hypothetical protein L227DRAFT_515300, partial [Lentinus tigrinus ALCF2SS1-6]